MRLPFAVGSLSPLKQLAFPEHWPTPLRDSVQLHGADVVFHAGLDVLQYPPTWAGCAAEYKAVVDRIRENANV